MLLLLSPTVVVLVVRDPDGEPKQDELVDEADESGGDSELEARK